MESTAIWAQRSTRAERASVTNSNKKQEAAAAATNERQASYLIAHQGRICWRIEHDRWLDVEIGRIDTTTVNHLHFLQQGLDAMEMTLVDDATERCRRLWVGAKHLLDHAPQLGDEGVGNLQHRRRVSARLQLAGARARVSVSE